jgi:hypothetical protein
MAREWDMFGMTESTLKMMVKLFSFSPAVSPALLNVYFSFISGGGVLL